MSNYLNPPDRVKQAVLEALRGGYIVERDRLVAMTGASDRMNRTAIAELRREGYAIAELSAGGYYIPASPEGLDTTIERFHSRMVSIASVMKGLRQARRKLRGENQQQELSI